MGSVGAQQNFHLLSRVADRAARLPGLKGLIGIVRRCDVGNEGRRHARCSIRASRCDPVHENPARAPALSAAPMLGSMMERPFGCGERSAALVPANDWRGHQRCSSWIRHPVIRWIEANLGLLPVSGWENRVKPTQTAKPRKITVCGVQRKPVFDGQCGQMGIWYEIAIHSRQREEFA
jgi:hypothetical protein